MLPLVVVPFAVYLVSWAGWFANYERTETGRERCRDRPCAVGVADLADAWIDEQVEMFDFQRRLEATHEYRSPPQDWPLLTRPVLFYLERCDPPTATATTGGPPLRGRPREPGPHPRPREPGGVVAGGGGRPPRAFVAVRRRSWPALVIAGFALGQYVPWFASWKPGFSFYLLPATPFVCLALGWVAWRVGGRRRASLAPLLVAALAALVWFRPIWYGDETSVSDQNDRLWFDSWR